MSTPPGALPGSMWFDTDHQRLHYVAADGQQRQYTEVDAPHTDAAGRVGSFWVET